MFNLNAFGFHRADRSVLSHADNSKVDVDAFYRQAMLVLPEIADRVVSDAVSLIDTIYGRWHPTGFMVFPLGVHESLGTLRLHIWPEGVRQRHLKGRGYLGDGIFDGDIHNHMWHISSLSLAFYCDRLFNIERLVEDVPLEKSIDRADLFRVFRVAYSANVPEGLRTTGACVVAHPEINREIPAGQMHQIESGQFHAPTVPSDAFGATLVLNSPRIGNDGPDVLIGGTSEPIIRNRTDVSPDEARRARDQFLFHLRYA